MLLDLRVGLNAQVVGTDLLRAHLDVGPFLILGSVVDECIKQTSENLKVLFAGLQLVGHLVCLVEGNVLLTAEIKEGLV